MKKPFWLLPLLGIGLLVTGMTLAAPQAAGVVLIVIGALGTFIGVGIWADEWN